MKKGRDQHVPYLFMAGLVAIVAIVALVLNGNASLEGAVFVNERVDAVQDRCTDDDPNNDFFLAGTVKYGHYEYPDHCQDGQLHQLYCDNDKDVKHNRHYECPNGCLNGACLK